MSRWLVARGRRVLRTIELLRVYDRVFEAAGTLLPAEVRSLDAIHLATAAQLGEDLGVVVTYDVRMADAAAKLGLNTPDAGLKPFTPVNILSLQASRTTLPRT